MMDDIKFNKAWQQGYEVGCYEVGHSKGYEDAKTYDPDLRTEQIIRGRMEEISSLDLDLLTILSRIYQAQHLIANIDPMAERILTCDAPRLAGHVSDAGLAWCERTDLDTAFPEWLRGIRVSAPIRASHPDYSARCTSCPTCGANRPCEKHGHM